MQDVDVGDEAPMKLEGVLETIIAKKINERLHGSRQIYDHQDRSCSNRLNNLRTPIKAPKSTTNN